MEGLSTGTGEAVSLNKDVSPLNHGHVRKRQRSNPGPDASPYDDVFGGGSWRYSRVSDPDIDYNAQTSKRYLSEVMASNLTRHMSLRPSSSVGASPPPSGAPRSPGDDMLAQALSQPAPHLHPFANPQSMQHPNGPGPATPPGGCSPQRTCASEMSEGLADPGGEILQPMLTSDASFSVSASQGGGGGCGAGAGAGAGALISKAPATPAADSTSETADSELLDERERSVSLSGMLWGPGSFAPSPGGVPTPASAIGFGGSAGARMPMPFGAMWSTPAAAAAMVAAAATTAHCSGGAFGFCGSGGSPFASQCVPRRPSDATQGSAPSGPACAAQQQQQHLMRAPYPRGHVSGGRGLLTEIPTSPSDTRYGGLDLRKTALLRSISRRAEETSEGGGTAAPTASAANAASIQAGGGGSSGGAGLMADSGSLEHGVGGSTGVGVAAGTATLAGAAASKSFSRTRPGDGGGSGGRSAVSLSDSGLSDAMSEGCGSGGAGGGATGMELSSSSADAGGGGSGTAPGAGLGESVKEQQQRQQQVLLQQLLLQQQQAGGSDAGGPSQRLATAHSELLLTVTSSQHSREAVLPGGSCVCARGGGGACGTALPPAHSCTRDARPTAGLTTALGPQSQSSPSAQVQQLLRDGREPGTSSSAPHCLF